MSLAFISFCKLQAQDSAAKGTFTLSGSLDAYYRYNFQNAKDSGHINNYTSFTNSQNSFELGMASVKGEYTVGKVDGVVDLGFGRRAQEFSYNDAGTTAAIKQAYVSYAPSDKVKFTMGKWATHIGYELLDAYLNRNYSMDYMFSYGPFFHTGIKMDVTASKNFGLMVGVSNPNDMTTATFSKKWLLGQVHFASTSTKVNVYL
ncbi:MAG TPA: outer membrane beta-barrel protein, partial [Chitinophagaceae bacterium]